MSELPSGENVKPFQNLAESVVKVGQGLVAYRDFIGRKKASQIMDELGINISEDEVLETALTDLFGTCVTTGIVLNMRKETDDDSVMASVDRLSTQIPEPLRPSLARFVPYLIDQGIQFHQDDMRSGSELIKQWGEEFKLLQSIPSIE